MNSNEETLIRNFISKGSHWFLDLNEAYEITYIDQDIVNGFEVHLSFKDYPSETLRISYLELTAFIFEKIQNILSYEKTQKLLE